MTARRILNAVLVSALPLGLVSCVETAEPRAPAIQQDLTATDVPAPQQQITEAVITPPVAAPQATPLPEAVVPPQASIDTSAPPAAEVSVPSALHDAHASQASVDVLCQQIGDKLSSISTEDCNTQQFVFGGSFSVKQRPLVIKEHMPASGVDDDFRVLIMGGIHGDEYSSISILFKWLALYSPDNAEGAFHWRFAPLVNPDGLLDGSQASRLNANGVDLNRNFPSRDWNDTAARYWQDSTGSNPRRFPGESAASEPEVQWVVQQIEEFQPDVIVSVHAPYHLLDFDGPAEAPAKIGELYLHQLGVYPGSLGNFAGLNRQIPVVTLELPSAGIMPPAEQIELMWKDLVGWLDREGRKGLVRL